MLPKNIHIRRMILDAARNGLAVAELEYLGLSLRVVNTLEEKLGVLYLQELIDMSEEELLSTRQLGSGALKQISKALERFPELESERFRWHKGSDRTEYYKTKINTRAILA